MFVMRTLQNYEDNNYQTFWNKKNGKAYRCKSDSSSKSSTWSVRSDLPSFIHSKFFKMRTRKSDWNVAEVQVSYKPTHDRTVKITSSDDAHRVLRQMWDAEMLEIQEQFCVLFMNNANEVIGFRCLHTGTTTASMVDLKLLLSLCCKMLAHSIIIAHNHPSGNTKVSAADKSMTWKIKDAARMLDITLHDHIILTAETYVSLADRGIIL